VEVGQEDFTLAPWFRQKYPHAMVPMLELEDGTQIGEAMSIAQYLEETNGSVKNLGRYAASRMACWPKRPSSTAALT